MTNQEKDQITAEIGKELPLCAELDRQVPTGTVLQYCFRQMGLYDTEARHAGF